MRTAWWPGSGTPDQGSFKLDTDRSAVDVDAFLAFPDNLEFEAVLTFAGDNPGELVARHRADRRVR